MKEKLKKAFAWGKAVIQTFLSNNCSMHAAGLTYYSMLAIVPILCVLLLVAKTCGVAELAKDKIHAAFEERMSQFEADATTLAPTTDPDAAPAPSAATSEFVEQARSLESGLLERIDQFNVGTLGWIGFLMLVWTVISSIGMVEVSFNGIWGVGHARALWRKILLYVFVALILPLLAALALSVPILNIIKNAIVATAGAISLTRWLSDGLVWFLDSWALRTAITLFFSTCAFAFLFKVIPNRRVPLKPAFWCGLATALLFGAWLKICAIAQVGIAKSSALYGSFALLPIILAWLYMSWQLVLFGCCLVRATCDLSQSGDNSAPEK